MKKKLFFMVGICMFVYAAIFTVIMTGTSILPSYVYEHDKLIVSELNAANKLKYRRSVNDGITTVTCGKMTGMDVVWENNISEDITMQMNYTLQVTSGKAKLILIQPGETSMTLTEQDSTAKKAAEQQCTLDLKKGKNKIKIVCKKGTSFALTFHIEP